MSPNRGRRARLAPAGSTLSPGALGVLSAVPGWWARRAAEAGLRGAYLDVRSALAAPPPDGVAALPMREARTDLLDATAEQLGQAYVAALDPAVRARAGCHYTPPGLATALWEQAQITAGGRVEGLVLDPACGAGALLLPPLRSWLSACDPAQPERALAAVTTAIAGCDLDEAAVWLGNAVLASVLLPWRAQLPPDLPGPLPALLQVADGLDAPGSLASALLMNPPYGRVRLDDHERLCWSHAVYGHANRYALFMAAGVAQLRPGGVLAALVPAGWLGGSYFQRLRAYLSAEAPLHRLSYVRERADIFCTGVLQETVLASFVRGAAPREVHCDALTVNGQPTRVPIGPAGPPARPDLPWPLPRAVSDVSLVRRAATLRARLSDYGWKVSTGPLVWNRAKDRISDRRREGSIQILWAADLDGGRIRPARARESHRWLQLRPGEDRVLVLGRPAVLVQRTTAPEQSRRLLAAELDASCLQQWGGRVVVENHVNVLTCVDPGSPLSARLLMALLDSAVFDRLYRCLTGSVAVSAYELSAMPLPDQSTVHSWASRSAACVAREIENYYRAG